VEVVRAVLSRATTVAEVAAAHVALLDAQIRTLRLRRALLSTVARRGNTTEETLFMHKLARLSAQERQQIIDDFVDGVFVGIDPGAPGNGIARGMRRLPAELPDDPAPEQVDAWIELAELVADQGFRRRVRAMALAGAEAPPPEAPQAKTPPGPDYRAVVDQAGHALTNGIPPASPEGQAVLARLVAPHARAAALEQLDTFTDAHNG
jgi:hypothetical protein